MSAPAARAQAREQAVEGQKRTESAANSAAVSSCEQSRVSSHFSGCCADLSYRFEHAFARRVQCGFTLIKLRVILVIIGMLGALIVPNVLNRTYVPRTAVNNLVQALKLYKLDNQRIPNTEQGLNALLAKPAAAPVPANWRPDVEKLLTGPKGRPYQYLNRGLKGEVDVISLGAVGPNADIGSWQ
jgi:general secretion pathway protein G